MLPHVFKTTVLVAFNTLSAEGGIIYLTRSSFQVPVSLSISVTTKV